MSQKPKLRIISGSLKGLQINFQASENLRPTPQRTKETLFNWLQWSIKNATCLDLFTGTGNLGIEALSRGAKEVIFVDNNKAHIKSLNELLVQINMKNRSRAITQAALKFLNGTLQKFDIIFLDAPFDSSLNQDALSLIAEKNILLYNGLVYYEHRQKLSPLDILPFNIIKSQKTGQVYSYLLNKD